MTVIGVQQIFNGFGICHQIFEVWTWIWIWFLNLGYSSDLVPRCRLRLDLDHRIADIALFSLDLGFGIDDRFGI